MEFKKSLFTVNGAILALSLVATACSSGNDDTATTKPASSAAASTAAATAAATTKAAAPIKLSILGDDSILLVGYEKTDEALAKFEADIKADPKNDNPNNRLKYDNLKYLAGKLKQQNIELVNPDWGWGEALAQKESAAFLSKTGPDIIRGETQMPGYAMAGMLEPFPDDLAKKVRETIVEAAWKPMEVNGKIYGVAADPGVNILVWNKALVKKAGLDPDKAPATWDELLANAKKVHDAGLNAGGVYGGANFGGYLRFGALMKLAGGDFVDGKGAPVINSDANVKAFEFLREINKYNQAGILSANEEGTFFGAFDKSQIAYKVDGPWAISGCKDNKIDCGIAPLPIGPSGKPANVTIGASFEGVPTYSQNKKAAFAVIEETIGDTIQQNVAKAGVRAPVVKSIITSDSYKTSQPEMYVFAKGLSGDVVGLPTYAGDSAKAWQAIGEAQLKSMLTATPVKELLDQATQKISAAAAAGK
jgi:multiple sugar transport system substrate-binding protein